MLILNWCRAYENVETKIVCLKVCFYKNFKIFVGLNNTIKIKLDGILNNWINFTRATV